MKGLGVLPQIIFIRVDVISCILMHFKMCLILLSGCGMRKHLGTDKTDKRITKIWINAKLVMIPNSAAKRFLALLCVTAH